MVRPRAEPCRGLTTNFELHRYVAYGHQQSKGHLTRIANEAWEATMREQLQLRLQ